jgi:hypothetical protein
MTDSSGSSPSASPQPSGSPEDGAALGDEAAYPAMWTRRVLVGLALLGVAVVVAAVIWAGGGSSGSDKKAAAGKVGSADVGDPAQGTTHGTGGGGASTPTSTQPGAGTSTTVAATTTSAPSATTSRGHGTTATSSPVPTTVPGPNFYDRGQIGPCPTSFSVTSGSSSPSSQAFAVASCLVHAWAWQLTSTKSGLLGMDALASADVIPTLLNLGHFLNHLQLAPSGCAVKSAEGTCTFTDGTTGVVLTMTQSAAYTYGWLVTGVSWGPAAKDAPTTTTTAAIAPSATTAGPASTPTSTGG